MRSPKFMSADGGWNRVVWIPQDIKERITDFIPPEIINKISTENDAKNLDELKAFLKEQEHPIVDRWVEVQEEPSDITVPTLEMPATSLPIQGLPAGMNFKIILKNAKIKAEKMIIKAERK
jgi:acetyl-CoA decarbonylase/synthase complex subunit beta